MSIFPRWLVILVACVAAVYVIYGLVAEPAAIWYRVRADLEVEGRPVTVTGTLKCPRTVDVVILESPRRPSSDVIAKRFDDGSAVLIGGLRFCSKLVGRGRRQARIDGLPPVLWLDNAEDPQEAELYRIPTYNSDPESRIRFNAVEIDWYLLSPIGLDVIPFVLGKGPVVNIRSLRRIVPWIGKRRSEETEFVGYRVTEFDQSGHELSEAAAANTADGLDLRAFYYDQFLELGGGKKWWLGRTPRDRSCMPPSTPASLSGSALHTYGMVPDYGKYDAVYSNSLRTLGYYKLKRVLKSNIRQKKNFRFYDQTLNTDFTNRYFVYLDTYNKILFIRKVYLPYHLCGMIY